MSKAAALAIIFIASPDLLTAESFFNGNQHFSNCTSNWAFVAGYVSGALDTYMIGETFSDGPYMKICPPPSITVSQATDVYCKFLSDHPEDRHFNAASLIWAAMNEVWPCPAP